MKRSEAFPSQYLVKDDLATPLIVHIADVRFETIKGDNADEEKPVLFFQEQNVRKMILNPTNWDNIADAYGDDTDNWRGKPVECYIDPGVIFAGKRVGGIRVRIPAGAQVNNGRVKPPVVLTFSQAVELAASIGMDKATLVAALKARGLTGYNANRDTAVVQEIVTAVDRTEESLDGGPVEVPEDAIPF